jgi:GxxExxY protein
LSTSLGGQDDPLGDDSGSSHQPCDGHDRHRCDESAFQARSRLLESAYEACLAHELRKQGLRAAKQIGLPVVYDGETIDVGYRVDLLVEDLVVVELKCVERLHPVHEAQLLSYIRLSGKNVGLLINFHVAHLRNGIKRMVDGKDWEK